MKAVYLTEPYGTSRTAPHYILLRDLPASRIGLLEGCGYEIELERESPSSFSSEVRSGRAQFRASKVQGEQRSG